MKNIPLSLSFFVLMAILSLGVACAKKPDDTQVTSDIQNKFSQDSGLSSKQLTVQANHGIVTLTGTVDNDAQREAAAKQAGSVPGVTEVINNLQVGSAASMAKQARAPEKAQVAGVAASRKSKPPAGKKTHKSSSAENSTAEDNVPAANREVASNAAPPPTPSAPTPAPVPPPPPKKLIIDQGTQLSVRLVDAIDSEKNQTGETFHATLNTALASDGEEALPAGTDVIGHLVEVKSAGKFAGQSEVVLQLDSITAGGTNYNIQTDQYKKTAASRGKNTAEKVGGGAVIGSIIGAIAGGGKGAAIGAAAGAGVGGGVQAATKSQQIKLPPETVLNFTLQAPVTVTKAPNPNANRPKLGNSQ